MTKTASTPLTFRERLARRTRPTTHADVLMADPTGPLEALGARRNAYTRAVLIHGQKSQQAEEALAAVQVAQAAVDACTLRLHFHSLPAAEFTALVAAHAPSKQGALRGDQWDPATFQPALIAACAVDAGMTPEQWTAELATDRWSLGDRNTLFSAALAVNVGA